MHIDITNGDIANMYYKDKRIMGYTLVVILIVLILILCTIGVVRQWNNMEKFMGNGIALSASDLDVYLINMGRNPDRLNKFVEQYSASDLAPIQFTRLEAVDGKKIDFSKYVSQKAYNEIMNAEKRGYRVKHYQLTRGAVGCYLSHMEIYKLIAKGNADYALIFEDDVHFQRKDMMQEIQSQIANMPTDWDMILLGCICYVCNNFESYYDVNKFILLHAYMITKSAAIKILNVLEKMPIEQQIDAVFSKMADEDILRIYCLKKQLAVQKSAMGTTIQIPVKILPGINPFSTI